MDEDEPKQKKWEYTFFFHDGSEVKGSEEDFRIFLKDFKVYQYLIYKKKMSGWNAKRVNSLDSL